MANQTQINLRVDEETKEEWEGYVEESMLATSVSHLIRLSVRRQIDGLAFEDPTPTEEPESPEVSREIDEVLERMGDIEREIQGISDQMTALEREETARESENSLESQILDQLPPHKPYSERWQNATKGHDPDPSNPENIALHGRANEIAARVNARLQAVYDELEALETRGIIESEEIEGTKRWYLGA